MIRWLITVFPLLCSLATLADASSTFTADKVAARQQIFFEQSQGADGKLYCGYKWKFFVYSLLRPIVIIHLKEINSSRLTQGQT